MDDDSFSKLAADLLPALRQALAGAAGSSISNVILYPLDLVVTRLKVQQRLESTDTSVDSSSSNNDAHYESIPDAFRKIHAHEGGIPAFYSGLVEDTVKTVLDSFFLFLFYNILRRVRRTRFPPSASRNSAWRILDELGIGIVAGAATKAITTPIQNIVTRKQIAAVASAKKSRDKEPKQLGRKTSVRDMVTQIWQTKGIRGFYSGYSATLFLTLNPSLTFFFDAFLRRVTSRRDSKPNPALTFLTAATSKALASTVTYPLSMAKARAQAAAAEAPKNTSADTVATTEHGDADKQRLNANGNAKVKQQQRRPANILMALAQIAESEGVSSLYSGVSGEVIKGFFSYGLTMLLKERLFALVIKMYYAVSARMRRGKLNR